MTQFEVRTKDLKTVLSTLECLDTQKAAVDVYWAVWAFATCEAVLVIHEFETPAEADAARLDWIAEHPDDASRIHRDFDTLHWRYNDKGDFRTHRELIDRLRKAPQPTIRVIATPEGPVNPI